MTTMKDVIVPKSDQINADDLIAGPVTVKIREVKIKAGQDQPVSVMLDGTDKAYRPCKSMCRVMVNAWGADTSKYIGQEMTLYCDPKVKWGGMEVGGIRISHMTGINAAITMALTMTRANKKPFTVLPLEASTPKQASDGEKAARDKAQAAFDNAPQAVKDKFLTIDDTPISSMSEKAATIATKWLNAQIDKEQS